jgi:hypothetical protein
MPAAVTLLVIFAACIACIVLVMPITFAMTEHQNVQTTMQLTKCRETIGHLQTLNDIILTAVAEMQADHAHQLSELRSHCYRHMFLQCDAPMDLVLDDDQL